MKKHSLNKIKHGKASSLVLAENQEEPQQENKLLLNTFSQGEFDVPGKGYELLTAKSNKLNQLVDDEAHEGHKNKADHFALDLRLDFIKSLRKQINSPENQERTEQLFYKIQIDEISCTIFAFFAMISAVAQRHFIYYKDPIDNNIYESAIDFCLVIVSITNFFFGELLFDLVICVCIKYYHYYLLYKSSHKLQYTETFLDSSLWIFLIIELILAGFHPNIALKGI